jgi:hypothetical protein
MLSWRQSGKEEMIYFIVWITSVVLWAIGGQAWKPARRFILPLFYSILFFLTSKDKKDKIKSVGFLSLIGINSMGYGEDSHLMRLLNNEPLVRFAYAVLLCIPFFFVLPRSHFLVSSILIIFAFQLHLGAIKLGKYDLLFEDVARSSAIAAAICLAIYNAK